MTFSGGSDLGKMGARRIASSGPLVGQCRRGSRRPDERTKQTHYAFKASVETERSNCRRFIAHHDDFEV
jgi:hypothetical protein